MTAAELAAGRERLAYSRRGREPSAGNGQLGREEAGNGGLFP